MSKVTRSEAIISLAAGILANPKTVLMHMADREKEFITWNEDAASTRGKTIDLAERIADELLRRGIVIDDDSGGPDAIPPSLRTGGYQTT